MRFEILLFYYLYKLVLILKVKANRVTGSPKSERRINKVVMLYYFANAVSIFRIGLWRTGSLELTAISNKNKLFGLVIYVGGFVLNGIENFESAKDLS